MKLVLKGRLTEDKIVVDPESATLMVDTIRAITKIGAWAGDIFAVYEVGDMHSSQTSKAVQRARVGVPEEVFTMIPLALSLTPVELAERYRATAEFPALSGAKEA